ncbi:AcrR family transcriptional regulator/DNA-binding transcriptional regulator YdaS (Cro superfamily) [Saccharopolyspora lacisalsi]|uniref:AcrR family transcriptional regulator/DNA-binding transcriptional regulator YdaS (Cro superfamily) n=1 Tax=Halosaccharopolyspora lacisalsi TaxID=1000566 RepID=A0A839DY18_9PSEU|nr:TetR family transcriptional regulator [Halosaccharopolyspora lacisalsi]MBA8826384.1 AcrR family transcriptional regulator/DNA-binding transcriptional regulator YdaS (Cro superfamily) [Halosaccharopolyspora lacisalsi]
MRANSTNSERAERISGTQVRRARLSHGSSLRRLATAVGVSPATLSQVENGRTRLSVGRLGRIAEALETTPQQILALPPEAESPPEASSARGPRRKHRGERTAPERNWRHYPPLEFSPVLAAALAEFLRAGYHGTSVRDIARRSGLSVSGLYHHYVSKQDMLRTVLELTMNELLLRSREARAQGSGPVERFALLVECLALFHTHRHELGFVGASEMRSLEADNRVSIAAMRNAQQCMVDEEVEAAVEQGLFHNSSPHEASRAVVTMCTALPQWFRLDGPLSPERIAECYVEFALDLMRYRSDGSGG